MPIRKSPTGRQFREGFTLLEILIVFAIIGLLMGLAVPIYSKLTPRLRMFTANHQMLIDLRHAHNEAIADQKTIDTVFYPARNSYVIGDLKRSLDTGFSVAFENNQQTSKAEPVLYFYADGSATPVRVSISDADLKALIRVDGLTGEVLSNAE